MSLCTSDRIVVLDSTSCQGVTVLTFATHLDLVLETINNGRIGGIHESYGSLAHRNALDKVAAKVRLTQLRIESQLTNE